MIDLETYEESVYALLMSNDLKAGIVLYSIPYMPPTSLDKVKDVSKLERERLERIIKMTSTLQDEIGSLSYRFNTSLHKAAEVLPNIIYTAEYLSQRYQSPPEEPEKSGCRPYPDFLRKKICQVIEDAEDDREKMIILEKFFKPKGPFDKWIQKASNGLWSGPAQKMDWNYSIPDVGIAWLKEIKKSQKRALKKK